jgi:chromosome segregation ATPase
MENVEWFCEHCEYVSDTKKEVEIHESFCARAKNRLIRINNEEENIADDKLTIELDEEQIENLTEKIANCAQQRPEWTGQIQKLESEIIELTNQLQIREKNLAAQEFELELLEEAELAQLELLEKEKEAQLDALERKRSNSPSPSPRGRSPSPSPRAGGGDHYDYDYNDGYRVPRHWFTVARARRD